MDPSLNILLKSNQMLPHGIGLELREREREGEGEGEGEGERKKWEKRDKGRD